jgi:hypothetical protein
VDSDGVVVPVMESNLRVTVKSENGVDGCGSQEMALSRLREQIAAATIPLSIANALPFTLLSSGHGMTLTTDSTTDLLALPTSGGLVPIRINSSLLKSDPVQQLRSPHQHQQQQHFLLDTTSGTVTAVARGLIPKSAVQTLAPPSSTIMTSAAPTTTATTTAASMMTRILPSLASRPAPRTDILLQTAREVLQLPEDPADYRRVFTGKIYNVPSFGRSRFLLCVIVTEGG